MMDGEGNENVGGGGLCVKVEREDSPFHAIP
jgi:hypothetical protein